MQQQNKRPYRILFTNGEMIVSGYSLRMSSPPVTLHEKIPLSIMQNPLPTTFHYLNVKVAAVPSNHDVLCHMTASPRHYGVQKYTSITLRHIRVVQKIRKRLLESKDIPFRLCDKRAFQLLHFYAHTIQLLFRRNLEKKRNMRCHALEYLLAQQNDVAYMQNEYVMRSIFCFDK
jgi:hypothetical protein